MITSSASAVNLVLDFEDQSSFFGGDATALAAINKAAADISAVLTNSMSALSTDRYTGTSGFSDAAVDWSFKYTKPSDGSDVLLSSPHTSPGFVADEIRIYVGMRNLTGTALGEGGFGVGGIGLSGNNANDGSFSAAVANMEAASNAAMSRGSGPIATRFQANFGGENLAIDMGIFLGNLWFDSDTNNDGTADDMAMLNNFWHVDANAAVTAGDFDLYSVAVHEMLHAIGYGSSVTWNDKKTGTNWTGAEAIAANGGSGVDLLGADGAHIKEGTMSTSIVDGAAQESVMDPSIAPGQRKYLTQLDLAVLRDLGYTTVVPEPTSILLVGLGSLALLKRRR